MCGKQRMTSIPYGFLKSRNSNGFIEHLKTAPERAMHEKRKAQASKYRQLPSETLAGKVQPEKIQENGEPH